MIEFLNCDCMQYMCTQPDNAFDLAVVDPPYFKNATQTDFFNSNKAKSNHKPLKEVWNNNIPKADYFKELLRISRHQIIWGINYYAEYVPHQSRIIWDKVNDGVPFSQAEIASWSKGVKVYMFRYRWNGMLRQDMKNKEKRIHPTQKPVALYRWLLQNYAKPGQRILDTHGGSFSSAIAAHYYNCNFVGMEIDPGYFKAGQERFERETRQQKLFNGG